MSLAVALYTAALAAPLPYGARECTSDRAVRMATIAIAIADETHDADDWMPGWTREDWAWLVWTKAWHESGRFDVRVHDGRMRGDNGRSVCLGQIMGGGGDLVGIDYDSTRACVHEAFRHLQLHASRCRVGVANNTAAARIYSGYGTGHSCSPTRSWAMRRAAHWDRLRTRYE